MGRFIQEKEYSMQPGNMSLEGDISQGVLGDHGTGAEGAF